MKRILILMLIAAAAMSSCKKKKNENYAVTGDYLVIGRAGGFTSSTTTTYYLINNGELRSDNNVNSGTPPDRIDDFKFNTLLPDAQYQGVKHLPSLVPAELLSRNGQHVGDVFIDAGYTDVRTSIGGVSYRWYMEADQSKSSEAVQGFVDSLQVVFR